MRTEREHLIEPRHPRFSGHAEGTADTLKMKGVHYESQGESEALLLRTPQGPKVSSGAGRLNWPATDRLAAIRSIRILLSFGQWHLLGKSRVEAIGSISQRLQCLAVIPGLGGRLQGPRCVSKTSRQLTE